MLSATIIHTPGNLGRWIAVQSMLEQLPGAEVLQDTDGIGDLRIANRRGCWPMARRAWLTAHGDHHLVLEDDALLCDGFAELIAAAVVRAPRAVLSLFRGDRSCSVATIMPRAVIGDWLAWADREARIRPHHDQLIDLGCKALGIEHLYTSPSLVEHAQLPSLLGHPPVRALRFEQSPMSFDLES